MVAYFWNNGKKITDSPTYYASLELKFVPIALSVQKIQRFPYVQGVAPPGGAPDPPTEKIVGHSDKKCSLYNYLQVDTKI